MHKFLLRICKSTDHFPRAHVLIREKAHTTPVTTDSPRSAKKWHSAPRKFKLRLFCCDYGFVAQFQPAFKDY